MKDKVVVKFDKDIHVGCVDSVWAEMDVRMRDKRLLEGVDSNYAAC